MEDAGTATNHTGLNVLNKLPRDEFVKTAHAVCATDPYIKHLCNARPFAALQTLQDTSSQTILHILSNSDLLQALKAHPRIGGSLASHHCSRSQTWSTKEQAGVSLADEEVVEELQRMNNEYFGRHGFVFLICATGKSGREMLQCLRERIGNSTEAELDIARGELAKIASLRWDKALREIVENG